MDCDICGGVGTAFFSYNEEPSEYRGITTQLPLFFICCSECTSEYGDYKTSKLNKEVRLRFHFAVDKYKEENNV